MKNHELIKSVSEKYNIPYKNLEKEINSIWASFRERIDNREESILVNNLVKLKLKRFPKNLKRKRERENANNKD